MVKSLILIAFIKGDMECAVQLTVQHWFRPNQIRKSCVSSPNSLRDSLTCIGACLLREIVHS